MKAKVKPHKLLSLLLALVMAVGMLPAMAAGFGDVQVTSSYPYDPNPQWVEINNSSGNQRGISYLKSLMDTTGPGYKVKYIKLTSDLEYLGDDNFNLTMSVNECVHLDLNGHELIDGYCIGGLTARQAEIWLAETARAMNERTEP